MVHCRSSAEASMTRPPAGFNDAGRGRYAGRRRASALVVVLTAAIVANCVFASAALAAPCPSLAGDWLGTSHCSARAAAPNCKEERVRYRVAAAGAGLVMPGERAAAGGFTPMGDILFTCDGRQGRWISDIVTPSFRGRWSFSRAGD